MKAKNRFILSVATSAVFSFSAGVLAGSLIWFAQSQSPFKKTLTYSIIAGSLSMVVCGASLNFKNASLNLENEQSEQKYQKIISALERAQEYRTRACKGCKYWYGEINGGNLLVCAMHPYGCNSDTCPDWEEE
ncbi:hypothetical protein F7734_10060 [Scytonema sp. UIC 10036]|uniref:hypothetical protein n=1 Tax=Scytonema sp. UIC 10036 TaxID=2304196 RepID=UPI0012DA0FDA|nr:hypothetical protein [Scytonema sp. UIC 10036]MUG92775.1 hypothetical protein [Scytonema sp. UIC 10036]